MPLRAARIGAGIHADDAGAALGISGGQLYVYEQGRCDLKIDQALRLAELYGVSLDRLLGRDLRQEHAEVAAA